MHSHTVSGFPVPFCHFPLSYSFRHSRSTKASLGRVPGALLYILRESPVPPSRWDKVVSSFESCFAHVEIHPRGTGPAARFHLSSTFWIPLYIVPGVIIVVKMNQDTTAPPKTEIPFYGHPIDRRAGFNVEREPSEVKLCPFKVPVSYHYSYSWARLMSTKIRMT